MTSNTSQTVNDEAPQALIIADIVVDYARWNELFGAELRAKIKSALQTARRKADIYPDDIKGRDWEMTIVLTDNAHVRELNHAYRGKDKATNVLSFSQIEGDIICPPDCEVQLGDIVLALETIEKEAEAQEKAFEHHVLHLILHGFLHLLGYDHETSEDAAIMEQIEIETLAEMDIENPYKDEKIVA